MGSLIRMLKYLLHLSRGIRFSRSLMILAAGLGLFSGFASAGMMALINTMINRSSSASRALVWAFTGLCIGLPVGRYFSQVLLTKLTQNGLIVLRMRLTRSILTAPLRRLEAIGAPALLATLTGDVGSVVGALAMVPVLFMHLALVSGSLAYMGWLSWRVLLQTIVFIVLGFVAYRTTLSRAVSFFYRSRALQDEMMDRARSVVEGTKELKMHGERRQKFLEATESTITDLQQQNRRGTLAFAATSSLGQVLFYILVGLLVIVLPRFEPVGKEILIGYTIVLFQMMSPLEVLLASMPALSQAAVAIHTIDRMGFSLESENRERPGGEMPRTAWKTLELDGVTHSYNRENEEETFRLGPISLSFHPGELVFIVGGNGSGKTTLAKLLIGLYAPETGEVRFAGQVIDDENREAYRQSFAVVFSDYFIFRTLFGIQGSALDADGRRYLQKLHLEQKVRVHKGTLSTVDLSQGQRKRLALLTAYLEDRPIYLFDEWAADQDPLFKKIFYHELLPELKARGKTVFVISHDDHYFQVADRVIKLDYGQLEFDHSVAEFVAAADVAAAGVAATVAGGAVQA